MSLTVNNVTELKESQKLTKKNQESNKDVIFNYSQSLPADTLLTSNFWSDNTKAILHNATEDLQIGAYNLTLLKTDNDAIKGAQNHLFGLIKYYEGDRYHYYEAFTSPYEDKYGNTTNGFGKLASKPVTQEQAYIDMVNTMKTYAGEVQKNLNRKIGKGTYESLPNSIKEALIDLCYNKGISSITANNALMSSLKNKDFSGVVKNSVYLFSTTDKTQKVPDNGLYRRSLNRAILATRDLTGKELQEAKQEVDDLYKRALANHKKNKESTTELNKIYEQYKNGKISTKAYKSESYKVKVDSSFKGKGLLAVARKIYSELDQPNITLEEFYAEMLRINYKKDSIKIGGEVRVPFIQGKVALLSETSKPKESKVDTIETKKASVNSKKTAEKEIKEEAFDTYKLIEDGDEISFVDQNGKHYSKDQVVIKGGKIVKVEEKSWIKSAWGKIVNFAKRAWNFIKNIFTSEDEPKHVPVTDEQHHITPFQRMLQEDGVKLENAGELLVASYDYKVKKGDNLILLSQRYGTTVDKICKNNNIKDRNSIAIGQDIKIQKMAYQVQKGDNLFRISKKFGLTVQMLKDLNNIEDVDKINENQIIEIPGFIYQVEPKDTLYKISKQVGVTVDHLKSINKLDTNNIEPGQKIIVTYNDADYDIDSSRKIVTKNDKTQETKEVVTMGSVDKFKNRELLREKVKINGIVQATRKVFSPKSTKNGPLSGKTILINAGHGYSQAATDIGTPAIGNIDPEWLLNYDNAMRLKDQLVSKGAKVIFLQGHINIMQEELKKSKNNADMVVSIHVNACETKTQDRTQIYSQKGNDKLSNDSRNLAKIVERNFDKWIPENETISKKDAFTVKQGKKDVQDYAQHKEANLSMLRNGQKYQKAPSILWEVAYMVSPKGRERMKNPDLMKDYAKVMANSIVEYWS